jgi:ferric-dicitrate binding protein FerR (iron transport regulator)
MENSSAHMLKAFVNTLASIAMLLFVSIQAVAATPAAQVTAVQGEVSAVGSDGKVRLLTPNSGIVSGDSVVTGKDGRAGVRFTDGSVLTLIPQARLQVVEYRYQQGAADNRSRLSLVEGGMRLLTGKAAKAQADSFVLQTPAGSVKTGAADFEVRSCRTDCKVGGSERRFPDGVYVRAHTGSIALANDAGQVTAGSGQIAYSARHNRAPQLVTRFPDQ